MSTVASEHRRIVTLGFFNIFIALGLGRFLYALVVPYLHTFYLFSYTQIGTIGSFIILGYLVFSYLGGMAAHKFGEKTVIVTSLVVVSISFIIFYAAKDFVLLCLSSFFMGSSAASIYMSIFPIVHEHFDEETYGKKMGFILSGAGCGIFVLSLLALLLSHSSNKSFNIFQIWIACAVLACIMILVNALLLRPPTSAVQNSSAGMSFNHYTKIWIKILTESDLRNITIGYFFYGICYASYLNYVVAYATETGGEVSSILVWMVFGLSSMLSCYFWGKWVDQRQTNTVLNYNYGLASLAILFPIILKSNWAPYISSLLFGFCFFGYLTIVGGIVVKLTKELSSVYMGKMTLLHGVGQVMGAFLGGLLRDLTGSFSYVFLLSLVALVVSVWFFYRFFVHERERGVLS